MTEENRIEEILSAIQKIEGSELSVREYFKRNDVPFSRAQYYIYRETLQKYGEEGLRDKRKDGNYTKLTERIKDYIVSTVNEDRSISSSQLQTKILNQFDKKISVSCLNNFRALELLTRSLPQKEEEYKRQKSGGGEIITSLAFFTHIIELFTRTLIERMNEVRESALTVQRGEERGKYPSNCGLWKED